eukprot:8179772-Prorocentrum_lima.AAC.1
MGRGTGHYGKWASFCTKACVMETRRAVAMSNMFYDEGSICGPWWLEGPSPRFPRASWPILRLIAA